MTTRTTASLPTAHRIDLALALLRVAIGAIFIAHGFQKFFLYTLPGTTQAFTQMGVPLPGLVAPLVATLELLGGVALVAGLLTRPVAGLLALVMLSALVLVHLPAGFLGAGGMEFPLALVAATVALALSGAGRYALDHVLARHQ
ncbi:quinol oxidase [Deinococcus malanensis]|uniref:Quinol oxidase n=1 Tax=Deinococcus malanensis TaxID=1706855 RepID=A0ABQ2ESK0_9DEIO|nr:DoxX family protein [Deinococcus malanensis]GGK22732.1 quinol oxidase [Deinococcus malanensis]